LPGVRRKQQRALPSAAQAEAYRILRSNLEVALLDLQRPTVVVTSAYAGEGKTSTTVNLARTLAIAGRRVVLVDLDLRHPDAHKWLGVPSEVGASDVLLRRRSLSQCLQFIALGDGEGSSDGLYLLPAGTAVPNPAELLSGPRTPALLDALADQADLVLIDTPPVLPVADALVIGRMVAGAVLVVETRRAPIGAVRKAKDALIRNQTRLLGVVVNKLQPRDARADEGYGYGYGYGYPHAADNRPGSSGWRRRDRIELAGSTGQLSIAGNGRATSDSTGERGLPDGPSHNGGKYPTSQGESESARSPVRPWSGTPSPGLFDYLDTNAVSAISDSVPSANGDGLAGGTHPAPPRRPTH
jgi:capsular exopolysaccharide synthesis family protein